LSWGYLTKARDGLSLGLERHRKHLNRPDQLLLVTLDDLAFTYGKLEKLDSAALYYEETSRALVK
jgi:hypothetical protein